MSADTTDDARNPRRMLSERKVNSRTQFPMEIKNDLLTKEQQLIFGLAVLNRKNNAFRGDAGYSYYLRELLNVTGFSADEAKKIIAKYENNPEKYLAVLEKTKQDLMKTYE